VNQNPESAGPVIIPHVNTKFRKDLVYVQIGKAILRDLFSRIGSTYIKICPINVYICIKCM